MKSQLLWVNWQIFAGLLLSSFFIIGMIVSAFYHPNNVLAPYYNAIAIIWGITIIPVFLLAVTLSLFRKKLSVQQIRKSMNRTYGVLGTIAAVMLLAVEPVPSHFTQYVGDVPYDVPRTFTIFPDDEKPGGILQTTMCIATLQGYYDSSRPRDCQSSDVRLFAESIERAGTPGLPYFFKTIEEFEYEEGKVLFGENSDQYQVGSDDGLTTFTVNMVWSSQDIPHIPVHFQVNSEGDLIRFAMCRRFPSGRNNCDYVAQTEDGILVYDIWYEPVDLDLELWKARDEKLLTLIESWKVES